jgi:hypothetical protein
MNIPEDPREEKALNALVAVAMHPFRAEAEVTEDEVIRFLESCRSLTPEEEACVQSISCNPREWITAAKPGQYSKPAVTRRVELAAMHRDKEGDESDPETEEELARKRKEIRDKLRKRRDNK